MSKPLFGPVCLNGTDSRRRAQGTCRSCLLVSKYRNLYIRYRLRSELLFLPEYQSAGRFSQAEVNGVEKLGLHA